MSTRIQYNKTARWVLTAVLLGTLGCFPGGLVTRGGYVDNVGLLPAATLTRGAPYQIVCWDQAEADRREKENEDKEDQPAPDKDAKADQTAAGQPTKDGKNTKDEKSAKSDSKQTGGISGQVLGPPIRLVDPADYKGGCEEDGEHSVFYLLNLFPVTPTLNPEYAISTAVQRLEGDTMIRIRTWHEVHYYSVLGRAAVLRIRGDVIRFRQPGQPGKAEAKGKGR